VTFRPFKVTQGH